MYITESLQGYKHLIKIKPKHLQTNKTTITVKTKHPQPKLGASQTSKIIVFVSKKN